MQGSGAKQRKQEHLSEISIRIPTAKSKTNYQANRKALK